MDQYYISRTNDKDSLKLAVDNLCIKGELLNNFACLKCIIILLSDF